MNRREFLAVAGVASFLNGQDVLNGQDGWRTFDVTTRVEVLKPVGLTRIWVPAALTTNTVYQRTISRHVQCESAKAKTVKSQPEAMAIVSAEFSAGATPVLTVTDRVATRNWSANLEARSLPMSAEKLSPWLLPTRLIPTDGIVRDTAHSITSGAGTDLDKARAIYQWIVDHTQRNPKTRGCGLGNIRYMLESKDLSGKCADLNTLFVGLARASGIPARDVYGIRVAPSQMGNKSLGAASATVTKAQHCRAEVHLNGHGWVPVDPADVRKVMLEEPDEQLVKATRARLFGSWEMNWMAYNYANDVTLPGSEGRVLPFLLYPQAETAEGRLDSLSPETLRYEITAELVAGG